MVEIAGLVRGVLVNFFVLLGFVALSAILRGWSSAKQKPVPAWQAGLLFGGMAPLRLADLPSPNTPKPSSPNTRPAHQTSARPNPSPPSNRPARRASAR